MKRNRTKSRNRFPLAAAWLALGLAACSAGLPQPNAADESRAQQRFPGATVTELSHGRSLYVKTCAGCHHLKSPGILPADRWQREVDDMRKKRGVTLSEPDAKLIVEYLWTASTGLRKPESASR